MMKAKKIFVVIALIGLAIVSCVKDEVFQGPPIISDVAINPQSPSAGQTVTVSAVVTDLNGVDEVTLHYKAGDASFETVAMTADGNEYEGEIPGQESGTTVQYYIEAVNIIGKTAVSPSGAPTSNAAFTIGAALIVMNEVQARGVAEDPDWIEIYNGSNDPVNISGYKVYDSGGNSGSKDKMTFPAGTIIPAHGFVVIVTDDAATANPVGSDFGISSGGEQLWLENADGFIIDTFTTVSTPDATYSYGRKPDGSSNFVIFSEITKGASNNSAATAK